MTGGHCSDISTELELDDDDVGAEWRHGMRELCLGTLAAQSASGTQGK